MPQDSWPFKLGLIGFDEISELEIAAQEDCDMEYEQNLERVSAQWTEINLDCHNVTMCSSVLDARWIEETHADSFGKDYVFGYLYLKKKRVSGWILYSRSLQCQWDKAMQLFKPFIICARLLPECQWTSTERQEPLCCLATKSAQGVAGERRLHNDNNASINYYTCASTVT